MFRAPGTKCGLSLMILTSIIMALFGKSNGQPRQIDILKFCEVDDVGLMKGKCPYIHIHINTYYAGGSLVI